MENRFIKEYNDTLDIYYSIEEDNESRKRDLKEQLNNQRITNVVYNEQMQELRDNLFNKRNETQSKIRELGKELKESIKNDFKPKADNLNEDTLKLLRSGINWSKEELSEMAVENEGNHTMLRVIKDYAKEKDIFIDIKDIDTSFKNIDDLIDTTNKAVGGLYLTEVIKDRGHRTELAEGYINSL